MTRPPLRAYLPAASIIALGAAMAAIALASYPLGSLFRPGPGFFPLAIGAILCLLGLGIAVEERSGGVASDEEEATGRFAWRPLLATCAGILIFALLLERTGLVPASLALVACAAVGEPRRDWVAVLAVGVFMALFGTALFIWGLGLPIDALGAS